VEGWGTAKAEHWFRPSDGAFGNEFCVPTQVMKAVPKPPSRKFMVNGLSLGQIAIDAALFAHPFMERIAGKPETDLRPLLTFQCFPDACWRRSVAV